MAEKLNPEDPCPLCGIPIGKHLTDDGSKHYNCDYAAVMVEEEADEAD